MKALALVAAGAFLRMVDDQKDLDYDRLHNPTRPLVQGRITHAELRMAMALTSAVALVLAAAVSLPAAAVLAAALGYGLALWWMELHVSWVRDNPIVNLAVVCPAQFLVTGFVMVGQPGVGDASWGRLLAVPVVFTSAFLHLEFARKTCRTGAGDPHSYSQLIGASASAKTAWAFGMLAVLLELSVTAPWRWAEHWWPVAWLPLAAGILPCVSAWIFLGGGADRHPQVGQRFSSSFSISPSSARVSYTARKGIVRILIPLVGSRGDVQPGVALGLELERRGISSRVWPPRSRPLRSSRRSWSEFMRTLSTRTPRVDVDTGIVAAGRLQAVIGSRDYSIDIAEDEGPGGQDREAVRSVVPEIDVGGDHREAGGAGAALRRRSTSGRDGF